jgi:hypothetical protein
MKIVIFHVKIGSFGDLNGMLVLPWQRSCIATKLFVSLFVYSRLSNFSAIRPLSPLPVTGLQI